MSLKLCVLAFFLMAAPSIAAAQNLLGTYTVPVQYNTKITQKSNGLGLLPAFDTLKEVDESALHAAEQRNYGFLPFKDGGALPAAYGGELVPLSNLAVTVLDSTKCESVQAITFNKFDGEYCAGLTFSTISSQSKNSKTASQQITLAKILNGGGDLCLNLWRPIYYQPFNTTSISSWNGYVFLVPQINAFVDAPVLDHIFKTGGGAQFNLNADWRILSTFSVKDSTKNSPLLRVGVIGNLIYNWFSNASTLSADYQHVGVGILEGYLGLTIFTLSFDYGTEFTHNDVFGNQRYMFKITLYPIKF